MIRASAIIALFAQMYREHWSYVWGAARKGCVDCSGAFVYAYKTLGGGNIEHGSNSISRKRCGDYGTTPKPGYAAFKVRAWSDTSNSWYGKAPGDVYHIGLVDADGEHVLNAKGEKYGFCRDTLKGWDYFAPLKAVDYNSENINEFKQESKRGDEQMNVLYKATVTLTNPESYVNVRDEPSTKGRIIGKLHSGAPVEVQDVSGEWARVTYGDSGAGYVCDLYLSRVAEDSSATSGEADTGGGEAATTPATTTLINTDGVAVTLVGVWRVAED